jgi:Aromatic acid exporter family member 2
VAGRAVSKNRRTAVVCTLVYGSFAIFCLSSPQKSGLSTLTFNVHSPTSRTSMVPSVPTKNAILRFGFSRRRPCCHQFCAILHNFNVVAYLGRSLFPVGMISTSLRTATPLPQVTPCPLLDRFMVRYHGLNVIHKESEDDYGLPRDMTIDTLKNEQYL